MFQSSIFWYNTFQKNMKQVSGLLQPVEPVHRGDCQGIWLIWDFLNGGHKWFPMKLTYSESKASLRYKNKKKCFCMCLRLYSVRMQLRRRRRQRRRRVSRQPTQRRAHPARRPRAHLVSCKTKQSMSTSEYQTKWLDWVSAVIVFFFFRSLPCATGTDLPLV